MKKFVFISVTLFVLMGYLPFSSKQKQVVAEKTRHYCLHKALDSK